MKRPWQIDRRTVLRGAAGTLLGLPLLEAMLPAKASAATPAPKRIFFLVFSTGTPDYNTTFNGGGLPGSFWPDTPGPLAGPLPTILKPISDLGLQNDVMLISGLDNWIGADTVPAQLGDHTTAQMGILTGAHVGSDYRGDISVDQVAANALRQYTPSLPSLFVDGLYEPDSYPHNRWLSWAGPTSPMSPILDSREAFQQVFGDINLDEVTRQKRQAYKKSVLHYAKDSADQLRRKLGRADQQRLDQYLTSVGSLESRIVLSPNTCDPGAEPADPGYGNRGDRPGQLIDLFMHAFQCDRTRVGVMMLGVTGMVSSYSWLPGPTGTYAYHADVTHGSQAVDPAERVRRLTAYADVARWNVRQFCDLVRKLKDTPEGDGSGKTMLDNALLVCTSEMAYGDGHMVDRLPVIVAGRAGGVSPGRYIEVPNQPIANLYVSMLNAVGVSTTSFGNSTGAVSLT